MVKYFAAAVALWIFVKREKCRKTFTSNLFYILLYWVNLIWVNKNSRKKSVISLKSKNYMSYLLNQPKYSMSDSFERNWTAPNGTAISCEFLFPFVGSYPPPFCLIKFSYNLFATHSSKSLFVCHSNCYMYNIHIFNIVCLLSHYLYMYNVCFVFINWIHEENQQNTVYLIKLKP